MDATSSPRVNLTCPHCRSTLPVGAQYCPFCGNALVVPAGGPHPVQVICPACSTRYPESFRYCARDGTPLRLATG